ncbi:phage tail protein, partial [Pantoea agglomerans]
MSFFNGLAGNIKGFATSTAKQAGSNLISNILSRASASMSGGAGASYAGLPPELANAKTILEMAMRIRYAQGWQWNI